MIRLEGLAGISPSVFFVAPESAAVLRSPAVLIAPALYFPPILFSGLGYSGKRGGIFFVFCRIGSEGRRFLVYRGLMGAGNRLEDGLY